LTELLARESHPEPPTRDEPPDRQVGPIDNPFPPGYGEDLLEDEER
jgi:hypothetical protein